MLRIELPAAQAATITVRPHSQVTAVNSTRRLETFTIRDSNTSTAETLPTAALFILRGAQPRPTGPPTQPSATTTALVTGCELPPERKPPSD